MSDSSPLRVGYVLKRYPRYSETFIVNEILAHEASGLEIDIFSLHPPLETHFQDSIARVRAPVRHIAGDGVKASVFWKTIAQAAESLPDIWHTLKSAQHENAGDVYQAIQVARLARESGINHLHAHFGTVATTVP